MIIAPPFRIVLDIVWITSSVLFSCLVVSYIAEVFHSGTVPNFGWHYVAAAFLFGVSAAFSLVRIAERATARRTRTQQGVAA